MSIWDKVKHFFDMSPDETYANKVFDCEHTRASIENMCLFDRVMTVTTKDGDSKYKGRSIWWKSMPMMESVSIEWCHKLSEIEEYIEEYGNPWPTAHLKKDDK